jgi:NifU-like domain
MQHLTLYVLLIFQYNAQAFQIGISPARRYWGLKKSLSLRASELDIETSSIISPFDDSRDDQDSNTSSYRRTDPVELEEGPLDLTWENVEAVLDEMRPYLIQDGGNVAIQEIDGPVVRLQLQVCHVVTIC